MGNIFTVGPNEALVVSGGCLGPTHKRTIVGGWAWAWWFVTDVQTLSLEVMTLKPVCERVETAHGVAITVTGVAQCKIINQPEILRTASEQFLGKRVSEVELTILQTLEGHLRAILGTLTVEEIFKDREQFASLVRDVAATDVGRMGIEILSFTIKDVYDNVEYLSSLGKAQTAIVKRDADIGVSITKRDGGIREAECERAAMDVKYSTDSKIEDNKKTFKLQKAQFDREINTAKADSQLAYELQVAKERQRIRNEEIVIDIIERKKQIQIQEQEILRKEKELVATVKLPAEAESFRLETIAEANKYKLIENAKAQASAVREIGKSEGISIEAMGEAEAERMRLKALAYQKYNEAAKKASILDALPKIAAELAAPLSKVDEIVLIGGQSDITTGISRLAAQVPSAISAVTGVDITKAFSKIPGAEIRTSA